MAIDWAPNVSPLNSSVSFALLKAGSNISIFTVFI